MNQRLIDEGAEPGRQWRVVEEGFGRYALMEVFTPTDPWVPRTWKSTPLDERDVWARYPEEAPMAYKRHVEPAPWWYRLFWGVSER